ncbi:MAG: hypothetical protein ACF8SC_06835 [Phycisphaerales bacterium JB037]
MAIYEVTADSILPVPKTTFREARIHERSDLQRLLRHQIDVIAPGCLVIAEEFGDWSDSRRRIDLLAIDSDANLVVVELKRTEDGGHMELQALRYASMVSTMTFEQAVEAHDKYLSQIGEDGEDAAENLLRHLGWDEPDDDAFAQDVRIVLASAEFSRELTSAVIWLNERGLDIRCVRLIPYAHEGRIFLDVQQVLPLPEAEAYQVRVREKTRVARESRRSSRDLTKYILKLGDKTLGPLSKRHTALETIRFLLSEGVTPEQLANAVSFRRTNALCAVQGDIRDGQEFASAAAASWASQGRKFWPKRWFLQDGELIQTGGYTYAVTTQWGRRTREWLDQVLRAFPDLPVDISEAEEE